jgi:soluble lytic murein transglycosylase-like protein
MNDAIDRVQTRIRHIQSLIGEPLPSNEEFGRQLEQAALSREDGRGDGTSERPDGMSLLLAPSPARPVAPSGLLRPLIEEAAAGTGLPEPLISAVISAESGFRADAVSPAGALGLMQLMPATARSLGVDDPLDPRQNVLAGSRYLRQQLHRFGSVEKALAAYNAGPGAVERHDGVPPYRETREYVRRVMGLFRRWSGLGG